MDEETAIIPITWDTTSPESLWNAALHNAEFEQLTQQETPVTKDDEREARAIVFQTPHAPEKPSTPGAAKAVKRLLSKYDFSLSDESLRLRTYAISRLLDLAESEKENIALSAIEKIGKIAEVGLFETKISVDINSKSTDELENELKALLGKYVGSNVIEGEVL
jgi:hypothetical protein